jgi:hypothetical protein
MAKKTKNYLVSMELLYDYDDEDTEDIEPMAQLSADGVRWEITSWLEELGFDVDIRVVEDREV